MLGIPQGSRGSDLGVNHARTAKYLRELADLIESETVRIAEWEINEQMQINNPPKGYLRLIYFRVTQETASNAA